MTLLAVYGTLRRGECRNHAVSRGKYLGTYRTDNPFIMFNLGSYPGIIEGGAQGVVVDLYEVDDNIMHVCDQIEGVAYNFYARGTAYVNGQRSIIYTYGQEPAGARIIESGDWCEREAAHV